VPSCARLQENPAILLNLAESNMEDHAEYGEMTTKVSARACLQHGSHVPG
jgi:hypothetical protein